MIGQQNPRFLRTLNGVPVTDPDGEFDDVTHFTGGALLPGRYTFMLFGDARTEQRRCQRAGYRTKLIHHVGIAHPYRELFVMDPVQG